MVNNFTVYVKLDALQISNEKGVLVMKKRILFVVSMALVLVAFMPVSVFAQEITILEDHNHDEC